MKRYKNPTRSQKMIISKYGYDPMEYGVVKETADSLKIIHKETGKMAELRF